MKLWYNKLRREEADTVKGETYATYVRLLLFSLP